VCRILRVKFIRCISCLLILCVAGGCTVAFGQSSEDVCTTTSRPDCREAVAFFDRFQKAVTSDERDVVASMVRFPLRVQLAGHNATVKSKSQLLRDYDKVFTGAVQCAIAGATRTKVWGNWQGYTVAAGVAWWEASAAPNSSFKVITINNGGFYEGCSNRK
jgi:hypothetical protein